MRSNTCPVPARTPITPITPPATHKFTELELSEQRRGLFGKKDSLSGMLVHSKVCVSNDKDGEGGHMGIMK